MPDLIEIMQRLGDLERRLASLMMIGTVAEVDTATARVKVTIGDLTTAMIPWLAGRAGSNQTWNPPDVGEQVLVLSPSGNLANGIAVPALYCTDFPAPSDDQDEVVYQIGEGISLTVNRSDKSVVLAVAEGTLTVDTGGDASITVGGTATIAATGDAEITGANVKLNGGEAGGVVCQTHTCAFTGGPHPVASQTVTAG